MKNFLNYKFFLTCGAIVLVSFFSYSLASSNAQKENMPEHSSMQMYTDTETANERSAEEYDYIIGVYGEKVAVFLADSDEPEIVFDVYVHYLPEMDRQLLEDGIPIKDYETLLLAIEDLVS